MSTSQHDDHTPERIAERLDAQGGPGILKDVIYGAIDGTVTTFAVVAGAVGAQLTVGVVVILGLANLFADGFSMGISNYLGTKAERDLRRRTRSRELDEIDDHPDGEAAEVREIYRRKGFDGDLLEQIVEKVTSDRRVWVDTMLTEEYGFAPHEPNAVRSGAATFTAFLVVGLLPLIVYFLGPYGERATISTFVWSSILTGAAFFTVGSLKGRFTGTSWWKSGLETLLVGGIASSLAYGVGAALRGIANTV